KARATTQVFISAIVTWNPQRPGPWGLGDPLQRDIPEGGAGQCQGPTFGQVIGGQIFARRRKPVPHKICRDGVSRATVAVKLLNRMRLTTVFSACPGRLFAADKRSAPVPI